MVASREVARTRSTSPGPYECKSKADCQKYIDYANLQIQEEVSASVTRWQNVYNAAPRGSAAKRTVQINLHTARKSLGGLARAQRNLQREDEGAVRELVGRFGERVYLSWFIDGLPFIKPLIDLGDLDSMNPSKRL